MAINVQYRALYSRTIQGNMVPYIRGNYGKIHSEKYCSVHYSTVRTRVQKTKGHFSTL